MTPPRLIEVQPNTPEWHSARLGYITASGVAKLFTAKGDIASNATSRAYIASLARARIFGVTDRERSCWQFERGHTFEPIARAAYETRTGFEVKQTGFWLRDLTGEGHFLGASPDGLVDHLGTIQIKTRIESAQWETIMSESMPDEVTPQIQAELLATGRAVCDYVSYCDGMHLFIEHIQASEDWQARITAAVIAGELAIRQAVETYRLKSAGMMLTERIPEAESDFTLLQ